MLCVPVPKLTAMPKKVKKAEMQAKKAKMQAKKAETKAETKSQKKKSQKKPKKNKCDLCGNDDEKMNHRQWGGGIASCVCDDCECRSK